jgi:phosphoglycerate dehydrogenase-like enzyme
MMNCLIVVDKKANGLSLKQFIAKNGSGLSELQIFDRNDVMAKPEFCARTEYIFSTWNMPIFTSEEVARSFPQLRAIFYAAGATDYFSRAFTENGVAIHSAQAENSIPVAEFVLSQILLANKGYFQAQRIYRYSLWGFGYRKARAYSLSRGGNYSSKVGIIGFGMVGSLLASLLARFDMAVMVHDPYVDESKVSEVGATSVDINEIFTSCDVISNHLPDRPETAGLLGYDLFSLMKDDAVFINTGRGRQIDEGGLLKALAEKRSRTALLDVTRREPIAPFSRLYRAPNVFISPHIAGSQGREIDRLYSAALNSYNLHRSTSI